MSLSLDPTVFIITGDRKLAASLDAYCSSVKICSSMNRFFNTYQNNPTPGCLIVDARSASDAHLALQTIIQQQRTRLPVIMLATDDDHSTAVDTVKAGAFDFLNDPSEQLLATTIKKAIDFDRSRQTEYQAIDELHTRIEKLTPREKNIMALVTSGKLNKMVASELAISSKTVELHRAKVMKKMQANSLAQLVQLYFTVYQTEAMRTWHCRPSSNNNALAYP